MYLKIGDFWSKSKHFQSII